MRKRLFLPEEHRATLREALLREYEDNPAFLREWFALLLDYYRLLDATTRSQRHAASLAVPFSAEQDAWKGLQFVAVSDWPVSYRGASDALTAPSQKIRIGRYPHLVRYIGRLTSICERWGLRCDWAPAWLYISQREWVEFMIPLEFIHGMGDQLPEQLRTVQALRQEIGSAPPLRRRIRSWMERTNVTELIRKRYGQVRLRYLGPGAAAWLPNSTIRLEFEYEPWPVDGWEDLEKRVIAAAREQRDSIRARFVESGFVARDSQPKLEQNIHWLYLRICPDPGTGIGQSWDDIAKSQRPGKSTITKVVKELAAELDIALPVMPSGRRRKFST